LSFKTETETQRFNTKNKTPRFNAETENKTQGFKTQTKTKTLKIWFQEVGKEQDLSVENPKPVYM